MIEVLTEELTKAPYIAKIKINRILHSGKGSNKLYRIKLEGHIVSHKVRGSHCIKWLL